MSQTPTREVARRVFADEFNNATYTFKESDDERAPLYALLPTGARANRVFIVGTLTEKEDVGDESEYWRGRIVDPTGAFYVYAGQYQPDAASMLRNLEPPEYIAVSGKPRTYETDEGQVNVSVRPESITVVSESVRDRWIAETAEQTLDRITSFDPDVDEYAKLAVDHYGNDLSAHKDTVITALEDLESAQEQVQPSE
ncbi:RPA family protein [Salinarchaeum sp. IM2453]|uniref:RPA family protein n=1 Tax=Salinarchaeum sp. IM2453 TaxID=2862870 RepID=UPI001C83873B|nr:RPA family protein [Salinarchaeum sp. IM2453]QZA89484.1 RPA family protein [Salinarchaeum sp. IM2453]